MSEPFPPTALQRRHAQTVRDSVSGYKIDYFIVIKNFLNPKGHQNPISGSKVTALGRVCACRLRSRLVCSYSHIYKIEGKKKKSMDSLFCHDRIIYLFKVVFIEFGNLIKTYQFCHGINSFPGQGWDEIQKVGCSKLNKTK